MLLPTECCDLISFILDQWILTILWLELATSKHKISVGGSSPQSLRMPDWYSALILQPYLTLWWKQHYKVACLSVFRTSVTSQQISCNVFVIIYLRRMSRRRILFRYSQVARIDTKSTPKIVSEVGFDEPRTAWRIISNIHYQHGK